MLLARGFGCGTPGQEVGVMVSDIGALMIRVGFWGPLYYKYV